MKTLKFCLYLPEGLIKMAFNVVFKLRNSNKNMFPKQIFNGKHAED